MSNRFGTTTKFVRWYLVFGAITVLHGTVHIMSQQTKIVLLPNILGTTTKFISRYAVHEVDMLLTDSEYGSFSSA